MKYRVLCLSVTFFLPALFAAAAYPHGGGLDGYGCHHNRKQGGYHCHRGPFAGQSFGSKEEMIRKGQEKAPSKEGKVKKEKNYDNPR